MKLMSFRLTAYQVLARTKTVTRRVNWWCDKNGRPLLKVGQLIQPVRKAMGLKKGEKIERLGGPIRIVDVRRERVCDIRDEPDGCAREGFPKLEWIEFARMFCEHNNVMKWTPGRRVPDYYRTITRIEFVYALDDFAKLRGAVEQIDPSFDQDVRTFRKDLDDDEE